MRPRQSRRSERNRPGGARAFRGCDPDQTMSPSLAGATQRLREASHAGGSAEALRHGKSELRADDAPIDTCAKPRNEIDLVAARSEQSKQRPVTRVLPSGLD